MIVDEQGAPIARPVTVQPKPLPSQDEYVAVLLRTEQMLNDAFDKLNAAHKREVLDEIERRRHARMFKNGGIKTLFPGLGMRRH